MRRLGHGALVLCLCSAGVAAGNASVRPDADRTRPVVVRGKVTAIETGTPVADAQVRIRGIRGVAPVRANGRGRYRLRLPEGTAGTFAVAVRAAGRWTRRSWVQIEAEDGRVRADWSLIPRRGDEFHMGLFNAITRQSFGTARWESPPRFRILDTRLECIDGVSSTSCPEWVASSSHPLSTVKQWLLDAVANVPALTGGLVTQPEIEILELAPGARITTEELLEPGVFTLGEVVPGVLGVELPALALGEPIESRLHLVSSHLQYTRWYFARIVAEGIGYLLDYQPAEDCEAVRSRGGRSMFCSAHGLSDATDLDAVMGAVLYGRPIGNRKPDRDPRPVDGDRSGSRRRDRGNRFSARSGS